MTDNKLTDEGALKRLIAYRGWMTGKRSDKHDWCPVETPEMAAALTVAIDRLRAPKLTDEEVERLNTIYVKSFGSTWGDEDWALLMDKAWPRIYSQLRAPVAQRADKRALDWLEHQYVVVRKPLRYGSAPLFDACPDEDDNPSSLRARIDAVFSPHNEAGK